jgi:trans-AT polyketide synthase/acyltransferase/oxidoreductase domain-containing protein
MSDITELIRPYGSEGALSFAPAGIVAATRQIDQPLVVVYDPGRAKSGIAIGDGQLFPRFHDAGLRVVGLLPALSPERLGDPSFCETHSVRFPYIAGEMANGIATTEMVIAMADAHMLGFFGAAGLSLSRIEQALVELDEKLGNRRAWGINLIHTPSAPELEERTVDLFIRRGVKRMSASAFMSLTPAVVRYAASGLTVDASGQVLRRHHLFAKLSRPEIAEQFLSPAPVALLTELVKRRLLTAQEATLAAQVPVAEDITVEADSGGHTDNRPLVGLLPCILEQRNQAVARYGYQRPIRVGAAGGLGTPAATAAAFALGASYVLTGTVNQSAVESGLSEEGKQMLANAQLHDVMMAPAADMFERGVKVQVLKRGTLFGVRAQKLYELYARHAGLEALPSEVKARLEKELFRAPLESIWRETKGFWNSRNPEEVQKAEADPKRRMALVFRWYLGKASRWAIDGESARCADYQIWCGPAMGAFNAWIAGSFLEQPRNRTVVQIARNLLYGAAVITRAHQLRSVGLAVPPEAFQVKPQRLNAEH